MVSLSGLQAISSSVVPFYWDFNSEAQVKECVNVLRNFYNYLLHHSVCPEYEDGVHAALRVCEVAQRELLSINRLSFLLPGEFNIACSTLFGGFYKGMHAAGAEWTGGFESNKQSLGLGERRARQVFTLGVATYGDEERFPTSQKLHLHQTTVLVEENVGLEAVGG